MRLRLDPDEELVARMRPHGRALIAPVVALLVVVAAAVYLVGVLPERWMSTVAAGLGALVVLVGVLPPIVRWARTEYVLTTRRVIVARGLRHRQELLLARTADVTVRRHGLQALAGSGDVLLGTGPDRVVVLADVPRPRLVQAAITELLADQPTWDAHPESF